MIVEHKNERFTATHMPSRRCATFSSYLAAKTWMLVLDDRFGTNGWKISCDVLFASDSATASGDLNQLTRFNTTFM
jgi:hypothetical protein